MQTPRTPRPGFLVECVARGEPDASEAEARATLVAVFGPRWADAPIEADDADSGLWLVEVPDAVAAAVLSGVEWADSVAVVDAEGSESLHSVLVHHESAP